MLTAKFDPRSFFQRTDNVALRVPASEVFSLLKRAIDLPPQWGALVTREAGDHAAVPAGSAIEADRVEDVLFVRLAPLDLKFHLQGLSSNDGFSLDANVQVRVELLPDKAELSSFLTSIVGNRRVIQLESLAEKFHPVIHGALAAFASERHADQLVDATQWHFAAEVVAVALQPIFFAAGLNILSPPTVRLDSDMYRTVEKTRQDAALRQAQHEASRQLNQALDAARADHMDRLAGSLDRLKELAAASPGVELPELIRTFSDYQRGQLYEALFAKDAPISTTRWIVAVSSDELLFFEAHAPAQPARRLRIDGAPGPARSVQLVEGNILLIGAARGVYVWPLDLAAPERTFIVEQDDAPRGGFNCVVKTGNAIVATHSELGICEWDWSSGKLFPSRFEELTRQARAVRNATLFDDNLFCSIDDQVIQWNPGQDSSSTPNVVFTGASAIISAIQPSREGLYAGTSEGDLLFWPVGTNDNPQILQRGMRRAIESISVQTVQGISRLVYSDMSPRIHARVVGDSFTLHYEAGGQTLRRVEVGPDLLVATNELRDRLICWSPAQPHQPLGVIQIGAISGRNVQDICLVAPDPSA